MISEVASAAPDPPEIGRPYGKAAFDAAAQPRLSSGNQVLQLETIAKELAGPRQLIEQSFLQMGDGLSGCVKLLETISAAHESLPAEFSSAEFSASAQTLHDIRASVNAMAAVHVGGKDHLGALVDAAAGVERPMAELRATVRAIAQIATNARILAAGFGTGSEDVAAFTTDMAALARMVNEAVDAFARGYERLIKLLTSARLANQAFMARHGKTVSGISETLKAELETLAEHRKQAESVAIERTEMTSRIRAEIGKAIFALQVGDSTRQRIEHVERALGIVADSSHEPIAPEAQAAVCHLQLLQLDRTIGCFDAEVDDLAKNINNLAQHAATVLSEGINEAETLRSASGGALARLAAELRQICSLIGQFEPARAHREAVVADVTGSMAEMVRHLESIRAIERQIRMLSFNATIQCCRVVDGEQGRGLGAVAQQLREQSNRTIVAASAIMAGLKSADEHTRLLLDERNSRDSHAIVAITEGATATIAVFEQVVGRLRTSTETIKSVGVRAVSLLRATAQRVSDHQHISAGWRMARSRLDKAARSAAWKSDPEKVGQALRDELRRAYTMEDERRVHNEFFAIDSDAITDAGSEEQSLDDLFL
jgi:hypothetical protein